MALRTASLIFLWLFCCRLAQASDWGYEDQSPAVSQPANQQKPAGLAAPFRQSLAKPTISQKSGSADSAEAAIQPSGRAPAAVSDRAEILKQRAIADWMELFTFATSSTLPEEQKSALQARLEQKYKSGQAEDVLGILDFWLKVRDITYGNPEQMENYRDLFRALLRLQERTSKSADDQEIIAMALGPTRIAVAGSPALTEDAINAYADMACFLYEQKNPGKTLDALDNRALFAHVIADKFKAAPSLKDKLSMLNFDLNWAKFKILWSSADASNKSLLLKQWTEDRQSRLLTCPDPTLELVLHSGPWHTTLYPKAAIKSASPGKLIN